MHMLNAREIISRALNECNIRISYSGLYDLVQADELPRPIQHKTTIINDEGMTHEIVDAWFEEDVSNFLAAQLP